MSPKKGSARLGIKDVARLAKVGVGTVSRVLNDHPSVSSAARAAVKAAVEQLQYTPDSIAQNMRRKISKTIGIVVPDLVNPFFAEFVQAAEVAARSHNHHVYLMNSLGDPASEQECIEALLSRKVDGIILIPADTRHVAVVKQDTRIIYVDRLPDGHFGVAANHFAGGRMATEYLLSLGHRRIAIIAGPRSAAPAKARLDGFMAVMRPIYEQQGLDADDHVVFGPFDLNTGRVGLQHFMSMPADRRPTAIFASADLLAIGALRAAADLGINVPQDLSIMGYDGIPMGDMVHPRLTTVVQLVSKIAETAVAAVLSPEAHHNEQAILLHCELLLRDSTGLLRSGSGVSVPRASDADGS